MHRLKGTSGMGGGRPQDGGQRDTIEHKVDTAVGANRSQFLPAGGVFSAGTIAAAQDANARRWLFTLVDQSGRTDAKRCGEPYDRDARR